MEPFTAYDSEVDSRLLHDGRYFDIYFTLSVRYGLNRQYNAFHWVSANALAAPNKPEINRCYEWMV